MLVLAGACVNDASECPDPAADTTVGLRFTVVTRIPMESRDGSTRAVEETKGSASENYLNLAGRDIRFLLFDAAERYLCDFTPEADVTEVSGTDYVTYTVRAAVTDNYFDAVADSDVGFNIMVTANTLPYTPEAFRLVRGVTTVEGLTEQLASFAFPVRNLADEGWMPSQPGRSNGEYIPMTGIRQFTLVRGAFSAAGPEGFVDLSAGDGKDINMLRVLAKIEIIDKIGIGDMAVDASMVRPAVSGATLFGFCASGTLLPAYGQWNADGVTETRQVTSPTMPRKIEYRAPAAETTPDLSPETARILFRADADAQAARDDGCPVFSAYVPEYSLADVRASYGTGAVLPYVRVSVTNPEGVEGVQSYTFRLATYTDGKADSEISSLLRNCIYRYELTGAGSAVTLDYTVCPWDEAVSGDITFN